MGTYSLGLDFGTLSVRALLLDLQTGQEAGGCTAAYPHGVMETALPDGTPLPTGWALQDPADYLQCMEQVCRQVLVQTGVSAREIVGIGLDFTSSTVLAVDGDGRPLCQQARYAGEPHAYAKLWKHHGAEPEARQIMALAEERGEKWLPFYGSRVSSEWMLPKILETVHHGPQVHGDTSYYIEAMDWITWLLTGQLSRSTCAAGYKSFYRHDDGYPSQAFCAALHPELGQLCEKQRLAGILRSAASRTGSAL